MPSILRLNVLGAALLATLWSTPPALAQAFPNRPLQVVTTTAGGGADMLARTVAQALTEGIGQPAVVINAGTQSIPITTVAKASPDGHTLLSIGGVFWLYPFLEEKAPYDPVKDFSPVTLTASSPNVVTVHPSVPANNVKELIALAKSKPGALNYGVAGVGASPWLAGELFKSMSGTNIVTVGYKGIGQAMTDALAGRLQIMFPTVGSAMPHVKAGKLRALAVTSARPSSLAPDLPTVAATGIPDYESTANYVVFVPARTPSAVINRLNRVIVQYFKRPEVSSRLFNEGMEVVGSSPQELGAAMKKDMEVMGKVIRSAGLTSER